MISARDSEQMLATAVAHLRAGRLLDAERIARSLCERAPDNARAFHLAGVLAHQLGRNDAATLIGRAVAIEPDLAEAHNDRGVILAANGLFSDAVPCFESAVQLNPKYLEARGNLGRALLVIGRVEEAVFEFERLLQDVPDSPLAHFSLADALEGAGKAETAERHYRSAISLRADFVDAHLHLAALLQKSGRLAEACAAAERAVGIAPRNAGVRNNLANILRELGRRKEAIAEYETALHTDPSSVGAHYNLGVALRGDARMTEAREHFSRAVTLKPDFLEAELARCVAELPPLYATAAEIDDRRAAYASRLKELRDKFVQLNAPANLVDAVGSHQPFYLPYQGRNDRDLQSLYGSVVCGSLQAAFAAPNLPPPPAVDEPVRLGVVSGFFRRHSNWKIPIKGWLKMLNRDRFRVFAYHTGAERDEETGVAESLCNGFVQGPLSLEEWRRAIADDAPHVLLFPETGMDRVSVQLAGQRLAAVQCTSWGHPVTSGFPTMDYFLSSELMEPPGAEQHYSEQLVRLPNLSIYYEPVDLAAVPQVDRSELGLRHDAVVYWCAQSLPKYLPQFDDVFARIACNVRDSQLVFIEFAGGESVTDLFRARLTHAFGSAGLDASRHCVFLPRLAPEQFAAAIGQCDVVLDSIGWSGCNSILESLAHNLPVVAFEGEFMRGRHAVAILDLMDVRDTIARTIDDFVSIASRLGRDRCWRNEIGSKMVSNKNRVYGDRRCIAGLEAFLEQAARQTRS
jgi:predicted O-linked N-acetylglucosamine transferase (SPINDLY family)